MIAKESSVTFKSNHKYKKRRKQLPFNNDSSSDSDDYNETTQAKVLAPKISQNERWANIMKSALNNKKRKDNHEKKVDNIDEDLGDKEKLSIKKKHKLLLSTCGINKELDKKMANIATKGVVNLFNAVSQQKKIFDDKLSDTKGLSYKEDKVLSSVSLGSFLDLLKDNGPKSKNKKNSTLMSPLETNKIIKNDEDEPSWDALQENFLFNDNDPNLVETKFDDISY
ncbi:unnamed protein product [Gordionus sp. m RMFG-2023]|uniref:RRP15-like protein n=1 Tax=Gordionus sp. m RMFG-2023 TaxID=3053472 RepID=UPI0030E2FA05